VKRIPTKGTEIAALEAARNEAQVRADGALANEKRVAIARLAMVVTFGVVSAARSGPHNWAQAIVGSVFGLYAIVALVAMSRIKRGKVGGAKWGATVFTIFDFAFSGSLGALDIWFTGHYETGNHTSALAILMCFAVGRYSPWHVVLAAVCAEASYLGLALYGGFVNTHAMVFTMSAYLVLAFLLIMSNRALTRMFRDLRQRDNLTRFLPRQVAERVIAQGPASLAPVEREITVLFSDIRGFTGMSERMGPRDVLVMLDEYFGRMSQVVKGHDGVVGKFIGDGLLAFWGVPDAVPNHAALAVRAARDMRRSLHELNQQREQDRLPPIKIGIGIHTGPVAAGMLGGALQSEYTVIGDAVNVASRIEGLTKDHGVDVLLSETTWAQLDDRVRTRRVAEGEIRGRKVPVVLYALEADPETDLDRATAVS
jgi:adenylate cyclase